jgi:hypothetical protein
MSRKNSSINVNEIFLLRIGSTWLLDTCYLYLLIPLCSIGIISNVICLIVFQSKLMKNINLYKYLRIFTINSLIICIMGLLTFLPRTPRYFPSLSFSFAAKLYRCKLFSFFGYTFVFNGNLLNIFIMLERMSLYKNYKLLKDLSIFKLCIFLFIFCGILNIPIYFSLKMKSDQEFIDAFNNYDKAISFTYCKTPKFFQEITGKIFLGLVAFIRDFVSLILEILVGIVSVYYFRKYQSNREVNFFLNEINLNSCANLATNMIQTSKQNNNTNSSLLNASQRESIPSNLYQPINRKMEKLNNNLTNMTFILSFFTMLCNLITFFYVILNITIIEHIGIYEYHIMLLNYLLLAIRHASNLIFFYFYNIKFRFTFKKLFKQLFS